MEIEDLFGTGHHDGGGGPNLELDEQQPQERDGQHANTTYDDSPYVTLPHDLLIRDRSLTVAEKFVDDKELEVSDSLQFIQLFSKAAVAAVYNSW